MQDAETMTQHMIARVAPAIGTTLSLMAARAEAATATPSASEIIERMERNTDFETVYYAVSYTHLDVYKRQAHRV